MSNQNKHSIIYKTARNIKKWNKTNSFFLFFSHSLNLDLYINTCVMWFCMTLGVNKLVNKKNNSKKKSNKQTKKPQTNKQTKKTVTAIIYKQNIL